MKYLAPILAVAITLVTLSVRAEDSAECPEKPSDRGIAKQLAGRFFASGELAFREGQFEDAIAKFVCSLRMMDHENTLFNVAHVATFVEDKKAALDILRSYVIDNPKGRTSKEIRKMIAELEAALGLEPTNGALESEGPVAPPPASASDPSALEDEATTGATESGDKMTRALELGGWSGVAAGGLSLVIGAVLLGVSAGAADDARNASSYDQFIEERDRRDSLQAGGIAMLVIGGVFGGAGAFLLLWDFEPRVTVKKKTETAPDSNTETGLELSFVPGPTGLMLKGRF